MLNNNTQNENTDNSDFLDYYLQENQNLDQDTTKQETKVNDSISKNNNFELEDLIPFDEPIVDTPASNENQSQVEISGNTNNINTTNLESLNANNSYHEELEINAISETKSESQKNRETPPSPINKTEILNIIEKLESNINHLKRVFQTSDSPEHSDPATTTSINEPTQENNGKVITGLFDGEKMIGQDGKQYSVPANYASKSKLVDGDELKLTIRPTGAFVYKQISPAERITIKGTLAKREEGGFIVISGNNQWRLIKASITFNHGTPGDQIIALIPKNKKSSWAALDNIIKRNNFNY